MAKYTARVLGLDTHPESVEDYSMSEPSPGQLEVSIRLRHATVDVLVDTEYHRLAGGVSASVTYRDHKATQPAMLDFSHTKPENGTSFSIRLEILGRRFFIEFEKCLEPRSEEKEENPLLDLARRVAADPDRNSIYEVLTRVDHEVPVGYSHGAFKYVEAGVTPRKYVKIGVRPYCQVCGVEIRQTSMAALALGRGSCRCGRDASDLLQDAKSAAANCRQCPSCQSFLGIAEVYDGQCDVCDASFDEEELGLERVYYRYEWRVRSTHLTREAAEAARNGLSIPARIETRDPSPELLEVKSALRRLAEESECP